MGNAGQNGQVLTPERIKSGTVALKKWFEYHPDKEGYVIFSGSEQDCWTPRMILEEVERKVRDNDFGHHDLPELILEAISTPEESLA